MNWGYRDVQEILAYSARQVEESSYGDAAWGGYAYNGADNWNGGGLCISAISTGMGLVDAHAAVRLAEHWRTGNGTYSEQESTSVSNTASVALPDGTSQIESTLHVADDLRVDHVLVDLDIDHTLPGGSGGDADQSGWVQRVYCLTGWGKESGILYCPGEAVRMILISPLTR